MDVTTLAAANSYTDSVVGTGGGGGGTAGRDGEDGATYTPAVDADGNLSWTNDKGKANPTTVNIMGPQGADGAPGKDGYLVQNAEVYSENEICIGRWTDGKPLYSKTFVTTSPSAINTPTKVASITGLDIDAVADIDTIIHGTDGVVFSIPYASSTFLVVYIKHSDNYVYMNVTSNTYCNCPVYITIKYTKTTDTADTSNTAVQYTYLTQNVDLYSDEEQVIGRWTDGKPLYRKIYSLEMTLVANASTSLNIDTSELNIDFCANIYGTTVQGKAVSHINGETSVTWISANGMLYSRCATAKNAAPTKIILEYTKTTDTADTSANNIIQLKGATDNYSTEETAIGTWIDGKPLYRKVYELEVTSSTTAANTVLESDMTGKNACKIEGWLKMAIGNFHPLDMFNLGQTEYHRLYVTNGQFVYNRKLYSGTSTDTLIAILTYTKTTDTV